MKKMKIFALMLLAGATMFTSCKKDTTTTADPTISFPNGSTLAYTAGASINVMVNFAAEGKIESVSLVSPNTSGTTTSDITSKMGTSGTDNGKNQTSATYVFAVDATTLAALIATHSTTGLTYTFTLTDQDSRTTTGNYTVTIQSSGTPFPTEITTGVFYHVAGSLQGAWDLDGDAGVSSNGVATTKSMVNQDLAGNAFTGTWMSDPANGTQYVKTTTAYASIYQENAATLYTAGSASATVTNPAANDVYIGKKGTKYYVVSITNVEPTYSTNTGGNHGRITFKYKK